MQTTNLNVYKQNHDDASIRVRHTVIIAATLVNLTHTQAFLLMRFSAKRYLSCIKNECLILDCSYLALTMDV